MPEHRRKGHFRRGRPVRPTKVTTRGAEAGSEESNSGASSKAAIAAAMDNSGIGAPHPGDLLEGPIAQHGFASDRQAFAAATTEVANATGLVPEQVIHEYWLVRSLHALSQHMPRDGVLGHGSGQWAFGGGTALTAAWGVVRRYSEDIDGVLLVPDAGKTSSQSHRGACFGVANWATDDDISAPAIEGGRVLKSYLKAGDVTRYIRFETSIIETHVSGLVETRTIRSLLHTRGKPEWAEEHPEIGGFELPCMRPSWIAVNKFDALHRRALSGDFDGITARGRDLYDLWSLASQRDIAAEIREQTPELWESAATGLGRVGSPRPPGGYADSPVFAEGAPAYEALRDGYETAVSNTVWGTRPKFETAVKAARSLDSHNE